MSYILVLIPFYSSICKAYASKFKLMFIALLFRKAEGIVIGRIYYKGYEIAGGNAYLTGNTTETPVCFAKAVFNILQKNVCKM